MKTAKMSSQQATYAKAKAIYDTLNAERLARYAALPGFETEAEIDARCAAEVAIDEELDFFAVETELREAAHQDAQARWEGIRRAANALGEAEAEWLIELA
jgi:hypothetical protein